MSDNLKTLQLTPQQKQNFSSNLKIGAIKELQKQGFLTDAQVQKILTNLKH